MVPRDAEEVLAIERDAFGPAALTGDDLARLLKPKATIGFVAETWDHANFSDRVVGHMVYVLWRSRIVLLRIATSPDVRRRGVASQMICRLKAKLDKQRPALTSLVPEDNLAAQLLLKANGFRAVHVHRRDDGSDSFQFEYRRWVDVDGRSAG